MTPAEIPALKIDRLSKRYKDGMQALNNISFQVQQGDFYALLGPNGAGKSTVIGIICSLINKTSGSVEIFGHNIDQYFAQAKRLLGLVPQEFNFNAFEPILEIVASQAGYYGMARTLARQKAAEMLNMLDLWHKRKNTPRELSGGMKRRLMIARALVHDPQLLILDEPTAGVDIEIRRSMWELLQNLNQNGRTIILTTHYLEEAEHLCRNIGIINGGKIIIDTSLRQLLDQLQKETFIVYLKDKIDSVPVTGKALIKMIDERTLEVTPKKNQTLEAIFYDFARLNIKILSLKNKSNRLEKLFMDLVSSR